ncbi:MAG: hypothetical protein M1379_10665 [Firmicutes bacterium]|nr:hypothetical protein [Bacillota bacterium]
MPEQSASMRAVSSPIGLSSLQDDAALQDLPFMYEVSVSRTMFLVIHQNPSLPGKPFFLLRRKVLDVKTGAGENPGSGLGKAAKNLE